MQRKFIPRSKEKVNLQLFFTKCLKNPDSLTPIEIYVFNNELKLFSPFGHFLSHPQVYRFSKPFEKQFAYKHDIVNYNHPIIPYIIRIIIQVHQIKSFQLIEDQSLHVGKIVESLDLLFTSTTNQKRTETVFKNAMNQLLEYSYKAKFINKSEKTKLLKYNITFITNPYDQIETINDTIEKQEINQNFGKPITQI
jgi:hypothetical protein